MIPTAWRDTIFYSYHIKGPRSSRRRRRRRPCRGLRSTIDYKYVRTRRLLSRMCNKKGTVMI